MNRYKSASTRHEDPSAAVTQLAMALRDKAPPSLLIAFASTHYADNLQEIVLGLSERLATQNIMGCTGESIVVDGREIEEELCISAWAAWWPDPVEDRLGPQVELTHATFDSTDATFKNLPQLDDNSSIILLADPYSFPTDILLARLNEEHPGVRVIGGMASGATRPGDAKIVHGDNVTSEGAVVAALRNVPLTCVVSQGCRPIGEPFVITKAERNVIFELGGHPAHGQLKATYDRLPNRDKELMRKGIHLGRAVNEYQDSFDYGDFLLRNVTGFDPSDQSISVADFYRAGQTVQFHLRDADSASEDLDRLLERHTAGKNPAAALLFTCNGRGTRLFEVENHDAAKVSSVAGEIPCAGFFCAGEIGPVGSQNFLHGFTASVALFE